MRKRKDEKRGGKTHKKKREKNANKYCLDLWANAAARRKFFEDYAKQNGFDPLIRENWYQSTASLTLHVPTPTPPTLLSLSTLPLCFLPSILLECVLTIVVGTSNQTQIF
jgi:hypothetical protein